MKRCFLVLVFALTINFVWPIGNTPFVLAQDLTKSSVPKIEKKRIFLKTRTTKPLTIYLYPFAGNHPRKIMGEISVSGDLSNAEKIVFDLETKYRELLWRKELLWRDRFERGGEVKVPFVFDLPERNMETELRLKAVVQAPYEKTLAEGENMVFLPKLQDEVLAFSAVNNLNLIKGSSVTNGSFLFKNKSIVAPLKARITIKPDALSQAEAQEIWVDVDAVALEKSKVIKFNFPTPNQPQLYLVGVQVFTADDIPLSGILEKKFLVQGLFAEVINFDYQPKNYWNANTNITIDFSGEISDPVVKSAEARIKLFSHASDKEAGDGLNDVIYENTEIITINRYRQITGATSFDVPWGMEQLRGTIEFLAKGEIVGTFDFTTPVYPAPPKTIAEHIVSTITAPLSQNNSLSVMQRVLIMMGVVIFLAGFIVLVIFILKKSNKNHLILALCLAFSLASVSAENRHFTHFEDETYTSSISASPSMSLGDSYFRRIPIRGIAETVSGGEFIPGNNVKVDSYFFPPNILDIPDPLPFDSADLLTAGAVMVTVNFTAETASDYFYEVAIEGSSDFLTEGVYRLARMEFDPTGSPVIPVVDFEAGAEYAFTIDQTSPTVNLSVTNLSDNPLLDPDLFGAVADEEKATQALNYFVSGPVKVSVDCGGDCPEDGNSFEVLGNFCSQATTCDAVGVRSFTFCDGVLNCSDPVELELKHFDGVAPLFSNFELALQDSPATKRAGNDGIPLKVDEKYIFSVLNSLEGSTISNASVDDHACGGGVSDIAADDFFNNGTTCQQKNFSCARSSNQRGSMAVVDEFGTIIPSAKWVCDASCDSGMVPYYCGPTDPNLPSGPKNCCLPECKFSFPYCFPLPFY